MTIIYYLLLLAGICFFTLTNCSKEDEEITDEDTSTNTDNDGSSSQDGTATVTLSNASAANGQNFWAFVSKQGTNYYLIDNLVAVNMVTISNGSASFVLKQPDKDWMPTTTDWTGTGGISYDIYIFTDADSNYMPDKMSVEKVNEYPGTLTIDGNTTLNVDYSTLNDYNPQDGGVTVSASGLSTHNGDTLLMAVFDSDSVPPNDNPYAVGSAVISNGSATAKAYNFNTPTTLWTGTGGDIYNLYIFIDKDNSGDPTIGDYGANDMNSYDIIIESDLNFAITSSKFSEITTK